VKKGLEIVPVSTVDEVLAKALIKPLVAIEWPNDLEAVAPKPAEGPEAIRAH
jgi:ATP-dependent Lon protease